jgi:hypothetical protein
MTELGRATHARNLRLGLAQFLSGTLLAATANNPYSWQCIFRNVALWRTGPCVAWTQVAVVKRITRPASLLTSRRVSVQGVESDKQDAPAWSRRLSGKIFGESRGAEEA